MRRGSALSARSIPSLLANEPGNPWENGYVEGLNGEMFLCLAEARYVVDRWRLDYNHHRPHNMLNWMTLAAFAGACAAPDSASPCSPQHTRQDVVTTLTQVGT